MSARTCAAMLCAALTLSCGSQSERATEARIERLKAEHEGLRTRFAKAVVSEPLVTSALSDSGQVVLAIRSGLIEELAGNVASRYLDNVTVDLGAVRGHSSGTVNRKTFLGRVKLGEWEVSLKLGSLVAPLRAGKPRVSLRPPDLINIDLPVDVAETDANASLHFSWDSAGLVNAVCRDFEAIQAIDGRVLSQRHTLSGALRLKNVGGRLTETPLFPNRRIQVRLDLTPKSWAAVEQALRSENTFSKCGMFMHPAEGLAFLRGLAAKGVWVKLPDSIFRVIDLPARIQESVKVNDRAIGLALTAESLRIDTATLWSSATVQVQALPRP